MPANAAGSSGCASSRPGWATTPGVLYGGTDFVEAVSERDGAAAYFVSADPGAPVETELDTRRL